jgi:hypothetical protein
LLSIVLSKKTFMKALSFFLCSLFLLSLSLHAQYKKDGTPDMRYSSNRNTYGNYGSSSSYPTNSDVRYQSGYTRGNTYVDPHYKTQSNNTNWDNYSTKGNQNPYTGSTGSRGRDYSSDSYNYGSGNQIQTGSRGGQYYINSNGNKTYVPKRY